MHDASTGAEERGEKMSRLMLTEAWAEQVSWIFSAPSETKPDILRIPKKMPLERSQGSIEYIV